MAREPGADLLPRSFFGERKVFFIIMSIRVFRLNELRWVLHRSPVLVFNICSFLPFRLPTCLSGISSELLSSDAQGQYNTAVLDVFSSCFRRAYIASGR